MPARRSIPNQPRPYVIVAAPARRKPRVARILLLPAALAVLAAATVHATVSGPAVAADAKQPMRFEPNLGQADANVSFLARGQGYSLMLAPNEAVLALQGQAQETRLDQGPNRRSKAERHRGREAQAERNRALVRMKLLNTQAKPEMVGVDELASYSNYLVGRDASAWQS